MTTYHVAAGTRWSVGRSNLTIRDATGTVRTLVHPESALWDLLSRGYAFDAAAALMGHIAAMPAADARAFVRDTIAGWQQAGLLEAR